MIWRDPFLRGSLHLPEPVEGETIERAGRGSYVAPAFWFPIILGED